MSRSSSKRRKKRNRSGNPAAAANRNRDSAVERSVERPAQAAHHRSSTGDRLVEAVPRRWSTETRSSLLTTELVLYVVAVLAVVMTALAVDDDGRGGEDPFGTEAALGYIAVLSIGYMFARGLAKSGSQDGREDSTDSTDVDDSPARPVEHDDHEHDHHEHDHHEHDHHEHDHHEHDHHSDTVDHDDAAGGAGVDVADDDHADVAPVAPAVVPSQQSQRSADDGAGSRP